MTGIAPAMIIPPKMVVFNFMVGPLVASKGKFYRRKEPQRATQRQGLGCSNTHTKREARAHSSNHGGSFQIFSTTKTGLMEKKTYAGGLGSTVVAVAVGIRAASQVSDDRANNGASHRLHDGQIESGVFYVEVRQRVNNEVGTASFVEEIVRAHADTFHTLWGIALYFVVWRGDFYFSRLVFNGPWTFLESNTWRRRSVFS